MADEDPNDEEREVLACIYEGDSCFKQLNPNCFQYKYCHENEERKTFIVELSWPSGYPDETAAISLDTFYNNSLPLELKSSIKEQLEEQAMLMQGSAMTYSLFDWMKENCDSFLNRIPEAQAAKNDVDKEEPTLQSEAKAPKAKKEQLSKAQKRKITERTNFKGERERGWDWVDVVKHLCQTGRSAESASA